MTGKRREITVDGDVAYVALTKGYTTIIDAEDVPLVQGFNWTATVHKRRDGSIKSVYAYRRGMKDGRKQKIYMHRVLMGEPSGMEIDHKDANGLNNRRRGDAANLRCATKSQNMGNARTPIHNTSGVKGVCFNRDRRKWQASIKANKVSRHLGLFETKESAQQAYAKASAEVYGEFGRLR